MKFDKIEYSVCQDCLFYVAYGDVDHESETPESMAAHEKREKNGNTKAHFVCGIEPNEEEGEDGDGYEEFSWRCCELCNSNLGGSRHGITLLIPLDD